MSGDQLNEILEAFPEKLSIYFSKPFRATGQSQKQKSRIAIHKNRIKKWNSGDKEPLINTFAHEVTHLVSSRFSDDGWNTTDCTKSELVSYGVGQLVADIALGLYKKNKE